MADTNLNIVIRAKNLSGRAFSTLTNQMQRVRRLAGSVARSVAKIGAVGGIVGIGGLATGFFIAAKRAAEFRSGLKEIQTLGIGATVESLQDDIVALSRAFGQQPTSATKAFYDAVSAGVGNAADVTRFLAIAAKAAVAGVSDLATASDALSSVMNAYGIAVDNASTISDAFFSAIKFGKTTFGELASAIGQVAPTAAAAGVSLNDLLLVLSAITKGGISTDEAATGLRNIFIGILKPAKDASAAAGRLGLSFDATTLQSKGLVNFLIDVSNATKGSIEQMTKLFPNIRALGPALAVTAADARLLRDGLESFADVEGSASKAFKTFVRDNPGFVFKQMKQDVSALFLALGVKLLPVFEPFIKLVRDSSDELRGLIETTDLTQFTDGIAGFLDRQGERITDFVQIVRGFLQGDEETRLGIVVNLKKGLEETFTGVWLFFVSLVKQGAGLLLAPIDSEARVRIGRLIKDIGLMAGKTGLFPESQEARAAQAGAPAGFIMQEGVAVPRPAIPALPAKGATVGISESIISAGQGMIDAAAAIKEAVGDNAADQAQERRRQTNALGARRRDEASSFTKAGVQIRKDLAIDLSAGIDLSTGFIKPSKSRFKIAREARRAAQLQRQFDAADLQLAAKAERFVARPEGKRGSLAEIVDNAIIKRQAVATTAKTEGITINAPSTVNVTINGTPIEEGKLIEMVEVERRISEVVEEKLKIRKRVDEALLNKAFTVFPAVSP